MKSYLLHARHQVWSSGHISFSLPQISLNGFNRFLFDVLRNLNPEEVGGLIGYV